MPGEWTNVEIAGKPADVFDPRGRPRFGILHLHGGDLETLRDRPAFTKLFEELHLGCVCPHGQWCWWGDRISPEFDPGLTPEQHVVANVLPFCQERWQLGSRAVGLMGISMGGQGALRLAFKHPDLFPAVAGISSSIDFHEMYGQGNALDALYDSKEQCRQDTAILHIHPTDYPPHIFFGSDPDDARWYRGNDRLHEKLSALGITHEVDLSTRAGGHSWQYFNHMADRAVRFLYAGLEQESRRLL
jgi:S-formylglutathione hydrolase